MKHSTEHHKDEQPIPVNQDEDELWHEAIQILELSEHLNYEPTIKILKSKYSIQLKSSPSPTPNFNDNEKQSDLFKENNY